MFINTKKIRNEEFLGWIEENRLSEIMQSTLKKNIIIILENKSIDHFNSPRINIREHKDIVRYFFEYKYFVLDLVELYVPNE